MLVAQAVWNLEPRVWIPVYVMTPILAGLLGLIKEHKDDAAVVRVQ